MIVKKSTIAYFSMEIALEQSMPTYSGGLGVLAGDTLRAAADLGVPLSAVTLAHRRGYFRQLLDDVGGQREEPWNWRPEERLDPVDADVTVEVEGRTVRLRVWRYVIRGESGSEVPVYLLDTAHPDNSAWDQQLTDVLYGGDSHYRLCQEIVLGMGGALALRAIHGHDADITYHMNEGHSALLTLAALEQQLGGRTRWDLNDADLESVRQQCVFTTHTPVPAGHDKFPLEMVRRVVGGERTALLEAAGCCDGTELNMTAVALRLSRYVNGVALRHRDVSREMFPTYRIDAITNGVHAQTWASPAYAELFDRVIPGWRRDNLYLRYAATIPLEEIRDAHARAKQALIEEIARRTNVRLDPKVMTIGFARRATPYKRADLIFTEPERLRTIARRVGPLQLVFGGKAHPRDEFGKQLIGRIHKMAETLRGDVSVIYLQNYEMDLGALMTAGVDLWLNNPIRPLEASGTSGMKAALNGVPSLSVLDGWWIEGHVEGVTGWAIGDDEPLPQDPSLDAPDLYRKLERTIVPLYYGLPYSYAEVMRSSIAINASFFNTQRMVMQYVQNAYAPGAPTRIEIEAGA